MKKLYVGNLSFTLKQEDLEELFSGYDSITSCKLISDRDTGRSKGFGFVEFSSNDEAQKAIADLNGKELGGRALVVNEARPQEKREFNRPFNNRRR